MRPQAAPLVFDHLREPRGPVKFPDVKAVAASEYVQTFDCATPGCRGEAHGRGRYAYCTDCHVRRGTTTPTTPGTPVALALQGSELALIGRAVKQLVEREGPSRAAVDVLEMLTRPPHLPELRGLAETL
jgi:hypothetical protein